MRRNCLRCKLPRAISADHDLRCTWHPRNRVKPHHVAPGKACQQCGGLGIRVVPHDPGGFGGDVCSYCEGSGFKLVETN